MTTDQTSSLIYLWVLQIAWWLAAILPLSAAGILIALGLRALNRRARAIEKEPVESKPVGFVKLLRVKFTHKILSQSMLLIIFGGLALGGMAGLFLQGIIQPGVQKAIESGGFLKEGAVTPVSNGPSLDFIFLLALVVGAVMVALAVHTYRSLCRRAGELAESLTNSEAKRPILVRWFHDSRKMGLLSIALGGWICFGLIMQAAGFIVMVVPWPASLTHVSFPWATNAVIWILVAVGVILFLSLFALPVWMSVRLFKLEVRYYRGNPTYRLMANVFTAFVIGLFGALLFMYLLHRTGIAPITGRWFDFIPPLWMLAYLLAYTAAVLVQVFIFRRRDREFTLVNIAVAFIVAFPGAVLVFALFFFLYANFLSRLFGQP